jgi:hypothetical protein
MVLIVVRVKTHTQKIQLVEKIKIKSFFLCASARVKSKRSELDKWHRKVFFLFYFPRSLFLRYFHFQYEANVAPPT